MVLSAVPAQTELWTVRVETFPKLAESIADILGDSALALTLMAPPRKPTALVEAIYGEEPDRAALTAIVAVAAALHKTKMPKLEIQAVPSLNWLRKVASDFPPLPIARWIVHGAHHRKAAHALARGQKQALQIDATNAFGTGEHPTTHGCLLMLTEFLKKAPLGKRSSRRMLDMGCGSGILAMGWAKSHPGARSGLAIGVDCDVVSVGIARDNAAANGLRGRIRVFQGMGYSGRAVRQNAPYDLIMANIFAGPLSVMAKDLKRNLKPGGIAILSGLLNYQANRVLAAHRLQKIYPMKCFRLGEWSVLVLRRKSL